MSEKKYLRQATDWNAARKRRYEAYWRSITKDYKLKLQRAKNQIEDLKNQNKDLKNAIDALKQDQTQVHPPAWIKTNLSLRPGRRRKRPGPKVGHIPYWRRMPKQEQIDRYITLAPKECPKCQNALPPPSTWHPHTQLDIPPENRVQITCFYIGYPYCKCCHTLVGLPLDQRSEVIPFGKYGPRFHGYVSYWKFGLGLTLGKIKKQLRDEYDVEISTGELSEILKNTAKALDPIYCDLAKMIRKQNCIYIDETGWRNDGDNYWLWTFSNERISYFRIQKSRGGKLVQSLLGKNFPGILISDFYSAYNTIKCRKQKCWAHLIRELRDAKDNSPDNREIKLFLRKVKSFYGLGINLQSRYQQGQDIYRRFCGLREMTDSWALRRWKTSLLNRLGDRLKKHRASLYTFIYEKIDGTNNRSERELRPAVLMRKVSHGNRSIQGAHIQEVILSLVRTSLKNDINYVDLAANELGRH